MYERSNLARRQGAWPNRAVRVGQAQARLRYPASWFLVAIDESAVVGMASATPLRGDDGTGPGIAGGCFLSLLFVAPERWGQGIGGALLDALIAEAAKRLCSRIHLLTYENNERSRRLYRSRGFSPTGRTVDDRGEWTREI